MRKKGIILFAVGVVIIVFTSLFDKIAGKGEIVLGPKSFIVLTLGALMTVIGLVKVVRR